MHGLGLLVCVVAAASGATASLGTGSAADADAAERTVAALRREVEGLRVERELAAAKAFYLRLDAREGRLALLLAGVPLQEHAVEGIEIGVPRVAFWRRTPPPDWPSHVFRGGRLLPARERDRVEVAAPVASAAGDVAAHEPSPPAVPLAAEEAYSVPAPDRSATSLGPRPPARRRSWQRLEHCSRRAGPGARRPPGRRRGHPLPVTASGGRPDRRRPGARLRS
jgi:hypothetical protein